jgi:hypothetical protein
VLGQETHGQEARSRGPEKYCVFLLGGKKDFRSAIA